MYQKDPVNRHHWRATISRPAEEIDISAKPKGAASQHLPNKNLAQRIERHISPKSNPGSGSITFSNDPIFGAMSLTLPILAADFSSDLLSLVVLDFLASKVNAPVNLEPAWIKLLSAGEIARFITDCCLGYGLFEGAETGPLIGALEKMAATFFGLKNHLPCRTYLGELLLDMIEKLYLEAVEEMTADFSNSVNFMTVMFEDTEEAARPDRCNIRSGERLKKRVLLEIIRQALHMVHDGPSPSFRIDLYRKARGLTSSRTCDAKVMELLDGRLPERHDSAVMVSGFVPEFRRSNTGADRGALSESDSSERWDYSRHNDYVDDGYDSPRDLTACDKECGYCGHCDY